MLIPIQFNASLIFSCGIIGDTIEKIIRSDWISSFTDGYIAVVNCDYLIFVDYVVGNIFASEINAKTIIGYSGSKLYVYWIGDCAQSIYLFNL